MASANYTIIKEYVISRQPVANAAANVSIADYLDSVFGAAELVAPVTWDEDADAETPTTTAQTGLLAVTNGEWRIAWVTVMPIDLSTLTMGDHSHIEYLGRLEGVTLTETVLFTADQYSAFSKLTRLEVRHPRFPAPLEIASGGERWLENVRTMLSKTLLSKIPSA